MRSARQSGVQLMWMLPASISRMARTAPATSAVKIPAARPNGVPLAWARADSQSSALLTATAGPNSSSWLNGDDGSTSAITAGATTAPSRSPPGRTRGPALAAGGIDPSPPPALGGGRDRLLHPLGLGGGDQGAHRGVR